MVALSSNTVTLRDCGRWYLASDSTPHDVQDIANLDGKFFELILGGSGDSRVGGNAPGAILEVDIMKGGGKFRLTLAADFDELGGKDLSVVIRANFLPTDPDTIYPDIGMQCVEEGITSCYGRPAVKGEIQVRQMRSSCRVQQPAPTCGTGVQPA